MVLTEMADRQGKIEKPRTDWTNQLNYAIVGWLVEKDFSREAIQIALYRWDDLGFGSMTLYRDASFFSFRD
jgi:hypothetical protein